MRDDVQCQFPAGYNGSAARSAYCEGRVRGRMTWSSRQSWTENYINYIRINDLD